MGRNPGTEVFAGLWNRGKRNVAPMRLCIFAKRRRQFFNQVTRVRLKPPPGVGLQSLNPNENRASTMLPAQILCKVWPAAPTKLRTHRCSSIARAEKNQITETLNP